MSNEAWLIGREMDASKKILVATRILVFDFELFIVELRQLTRGCRETILCLLDCYSSMLSLLGPVFAE